MDFVETLKGRGMLAQITHPEELHAHLAEGPRTAYIGFDPTASSLHVGSLMPIMALRRWQQAGHRVIAIVGGGTALVGDPSGKSDMRQMLTREQIDANMDGIKKQLERFVDMSDPSRGVILNNADWLASLNYLEFLREIGPHFSVNRMLTAECFRQRLEKGLSFLEFNYMLLQSYDFLHLYREEACTIQMGGQLRTGKKWARRKKEQFGSMQTGRVPMSTSSSGAMLKTLRFATVSLILLSYP